MRPLRALTIYILAVFIGGALLAPWLYWLVQHFADDFPKLARSPLSRYVHRAWIGIALIGLWPLFKNFGATSAAEIGLVKPAGQWKNVRAGFLLGFLSLAVVAGLALAVHGRQFNQSITTSKVIERFITAALTAVTVAAIEEILFRGALFGALRKVLDWKLALLISSMFYAIVHFIESARFEGTVTWLSGLALLPRMLRGMADFHSLVPGFFNLTLAGALLALAYQRTGNLYFSMGLHCGWIFWVKFYGFVTQDVPGANPWWWGTAKLIDGWAALPVLALALLVVTRLPFGKKNTAARMNALPAGIKASVNAALGFLFPEACQVCGTERAAPADGFVGAHCWGQVRFIKPPFCERCGLPYDGDITTPFECTNCREMELHFRSARSAVAARGPVLDAIHRYKYQRALWFEPFLADLLIRQAEPELRRENWHRIVPVPLHPAKKREREFNQAERLAARLGRATGIPVDTGLLKRITPTRTQTLLTREQRAENVRKAFVMGRAEKLTGQRLVVLDDVFTTGATTSACAKVLLTAGAEEVCVWTVARGL